MIIIISGERERERVQGEPAREWYRPAFYREAQEGRTGKTKLGRTLQRASLAVCSPSQKGIVLEFLITISIHTSIHYQDRGERKKYRLLCDLGKIIMSEAQPAASWGMDHILR